MGEGDGGRAGGGDRTAMSLNRDNAIPSITFL